MGYTNAIDNTIGGIDDKSYGFPKYQVVIPREIREKMTVKKGQQMTVIAKGDVIYLVPVLSVKSFRGSAKGIPSDSLREKKDRL